MVEVSRFERRSTISGNCVLVVEDDPSLRAFLVTLLESAGYAIRQAGSGAEALATLEEETPAVALLDIDIPDMNGYAVCQKLRERYDDRIAIIFLSGTRTESYDRVGGLLIGADDYMVKPFDPDELLARIGRFATRLSTTRASEPSSSTRPFALTPREAEILGRLGEGMDQSQIANELVISPKTVATHIQNILAKLGVSSRAQAVAFAARHGLITAVDDRETAARAG